jgi:hypothetical protein
MANPANPNETQSSPASTGTSTGVAARKARVPRKAAALKSDSAPQAPTTSDPKTVEHNGSTWNTIIDGWVRDPMIRAYFFQMLLVVVLGGIIALGLLSGVFAAIYRSRRAAVAPGSGNVQSRNRAVRRGRHRWYGSCC